jgi:hypothetical protein
MCNDMGNVDHLGTYLPNYHPPTYLPTHQPTHLPIYYLLAYTTTHPPTHYYNSRFFYTKESNKKGPHLDKC